MLRFICKSKGVGRSICLKIKVTRTLGTPVRTIKFYWSRVIILLTSDEDCFIYEPEIFLCI